MACLCGSSCINHNRQSSQISGGFDLCDYCAPANMSYTKFENSFLKRHKLWIYKQDLIQDYKRSRQSQVKCLEIRPDTVGEGSSDYISLQCSALVKLAELIENYRAHPCKTVFGGLYYSAINAQDTFCETLCGNFNPDGFEEALVGQWGDDIDTHTNNPGVPVYLVSSLPFHGPTRLLLLLYIVKGMRQTFGCDVEVEYNCYNSARISVARQNLFPLWQVDPTCPTIYIADFDLRICLRTLCCPSFQACKNWLDIADVFLLHNCFDLDVRDVVLSPDLKFVYDRRDFPLSPKCSLDSDLTYRLHWRALCRTFSQTLVARLVFLHLDYAPDSNDSYTFYRGDCDNNLFQPLITWNLSLKERCQNLVTHECVVDKSTSPWPDLKLCQVDCANNLGLCVNVGERIDYVVDDNINSYQSKDISMFYKQFDNSNRRDADVEYMWVLNKADLFCPDPVNPCFEIDYHKLTVSCSDIWHHSLMDCIAHFHHKMNTVKPVCRQCYYTGDFVIVVRTYVPPEK